MEREWGQPETAVLDRTRDLLESGRRAVLATLVDVKGSAYRRPGAKLVAPEGCEGAGAVTAGCLEDEVKRLTGSVLEEGTPRLETFDLRTDDAWGLGIGCDGTVEVLLEPLNQSLRPVLSAHDDRQPCTLLTVIDGEGEVALGDRACYREGDSVVTTRGEWPFWLVDGVRDVAERLASSGRGETVTVDGPTGSVRVFADGIAPPPRLLVVGTGNDAPPVARTGLQAGFSVTVAGFRGGKADPERFPWAAEVVSTSPVDLLDAVDVGLETYTVLMTHNFVDDRLALESLLASPTPYIGIVASTGRVENLLDAIGEDCRSLDLADCDRIYAPVGLNLGGGAPGQIALSIAGEVLAVHNDRTPGHLRNRTGPVHDRPD
jgi:xanthine dehydrogenase accessory factor